ncbi:MAG: hypothetical protein LBJ67_07445 [Planctomycetaceae bacterium]|jgi:hypothetical protein|nr:hypothetical protein [Planctomycetaceae bacterium]
MKRIFLVGILTLLHVATVAADVTVYVKASKTGPIDTTTDKVKEKIGKDEQVSYEITGSYNGQPPLNAEEKVTDASWEYTISAGQNVTCNPTFGSSHKATFTASSSNAGEYTITITMKLILTITKYKPDMTTVVSTRTTNPYYGTTAATLDVWGKLEIDAPEYLPVNSTRQTVTITVDATLTGGTLTLTATDKLKLYENSTGGAGTNSLTLSLTNNTATCYVVSGDTPSANASDQELTATYSGTNTETATNDLTVYKLTIEAPNKMVDIGNGKFAVPVMFNDDHDCGKTYTANWSCGTNCSRVTSSGKCPDDTHRELEPVWDYLYAGSYNEDDLVAFKVEIKPTDMAGDVTVSPFLDSNIRFWKQANKGDKNSIITEKKYSVSELPQKLYVEGIGIGLGLIVAKYTPPENKTVEETKTLICAVVSLIEKQNGKRWIINENAKPIEFSVDFGTFFSDKFTWTIPGHNNPTSIGTKNTTTVTYGESGYDVTLPEDAANRRFTTTVSVSIDGKLKLSKTIRVAQATYQGTTVAGSLGERRTQVPTLAALPTMDTMPAAPNYYSAENYDSRFGTNFAVTDNKKIRYATKLTPYGRTLATFTGSDIKIFAVMVSNVAYDDGLKLADLMSIAEHEARHANQFIWMCADNPNWMKLERSITIDKVANFAEADAYTRNMLSQGCWKYIATRFELFKAENYDKAVATYEKKIRDTANSSRSNSDTELLNAMKSILQDVYKEIPFEEMKKTGYEHNVRPPRSF